MTQDEIIEMAREATNNEPIYCRQEFTFSAKQLQAFAKFVAAKEREACANICDEYSATGKIEEFDRGWLACAKNIATAIRARGEQVATNDIPKERVDEIQKQRHEANVQKFLGAPQPEQEPVAWLCLIAEADFSENTVILAMQCTDYKVSAGNHWLSNTPPQRKPLTDEEIINKCLDSGFERNSLGWSFTYGKLDYHLLKLARAIEAAHGIKENKHD